MALEKNGAVRNAWNESFVTLKKAQAVPKTKLAASRFHDSIEILESKTKL
jgi:hypothetical protein